MREVVIELLEEQVRKGGSEHLHYYPDSAFVRVAEDDCKDIQGLLRAVRRDWEFLWGLGPKLEATSELLGLDEIVGNGPSKKAMRPIAPPTHPATFHNLGRPPPNKRWAPNKGKTLVERIVGLERQSGKYARRNNEWEGSEASMDLEQILDDLVEIEELYEEYGLEFDELQEEY
jgi:hypothetical protein